MLDLLDRREPERLAALNSYDVLDTPRERDFDDIAALAAQLCDAPIALVSLVDSDRQWFKAGVGLDVCQTAREGSFCAYAMHSADVMQVPDALADPRFATSPLVLGAPHVRFYAGAPLVSPEGQPLGSLCVIDHRPRLLTPAQRQGLRTLARHVMGQLELRQYARSAVAANDRLRAADRLKDEFIARVNHELRTPLTSINGYLEALEDGLPPATAATFLDRIRRNSDRLTSLVDDMLLAAELGARSIRLHRSATDVSTLAREVAAGNQVLAAAKGLRVVVDAELPVIACADGHRLRQALDRLLLNAVKFTPHGTITVRVRAAGTGAIIEVADTGIGIAPGEAARLCEPFRRGAEAERTEIPGAGLGLSIVRAIVEQHGGAVEVRSVLGEGTTVAVTLPAA
ncbi:GAF domain-containing sensor histidine kinase [Symbioplanes lichenis]|uniref:GAF domain-containing sensor histidine kinase n=1 Tax=Symbioplanes lichenis TaxID=1629072 RepID=UPI002738BE10|nr:GAF domain-containing sensor histidine kinase [Actinoplanes lichenis]